MSCIEQLKYNLLLERISFKEAREYVEKNADDVYYVDPGYKIFKDYYIIGVPPVALGVKGNELIFPYVKPCHGTFVMSIESPEEIQRLREKGRRKETAKVSKKKAEAETEAAPSSFQDMWKK
jgi:hypothetical protein